MSLPAISKRPVNACYGCRHRFSSRFEVEVTINSFYCLMNWLNDNLSLKSDNIIIALRLHRYDLHHDVAVLYVCAAGMMNCLAPAISTRKGDKDARPARRDSP